MRGRDRAGDADDCVDSVALRGGDAGDGSCSHGSCRPLPLDVAVGLSLPDAMTPMAHPDGAPNDVAVIPDAHCPSSARLPSLGEPPLSTVWLPVCRRVEPECGTESAPVVPVVPVVPVAVLSVVAAVMGESFMSAAASARARRAAGRSQYHAAATATASSAAAVDTTGATTDTRPDAEV